MELNNIISEFNKSPIPNINAGGCGIFALELYKHLRPLRPSLYLISSLAEAKALKVGGLEASGIPHLLVKVQGKFIDSRGVFNTFQKFTKGKYWGGCIN